MNLERKYPFIASWIVDGQIDAYESFATVIDPGGVVWESDDEYETLDGLLDAMELGIGRFCRENGIKLRDLNDNLISWPED